MRIVIKVGTSLIAPGGQIDANILRALVDQFDLSEHEYLIVTSGAIAAGMSGLGLQKRPNDVPGMQACAAVGQSRLMSLYESLFQEFGLRVAQVWRRPAGRCISVGGCGSRGPDA